VQNFLFCFAILAQGRGDTGGPWGAYVLHSITEGNRIFRNKKIFCLLGLVHLIPK
jgi:hypothetical protein